jgi:20S proteasome alpha/beta subunit
MTIAAGFVVSDGVVLCTDSQYTAGIKRYGTKIFPLQLNGGAVAFALAGHEPFAKRAIEECCKFLDANEESQNSISGIKDTVELGLESFYQRFVHTRPNGARESVRFELLVAAASVKEKPVMFSACETVLIPIPKYECLGAGYFVGEHVIETGYSKGMSLDDAVVLAIHATAVAKEYVDGVGGPTQILWIKDGTVSLFHPINTAIFTENYIMSYERRSAELLFHAANPKLSDEDFQQHADRFIRHVGFIRRHWRESFENQDLLQMLLRTDKPSPESPKRDP